MADTTRARKTARAVYARREAVLWAGLAYCLFHAPDFAGQLGAVLSTVGAIATAIRP